MKTITQKLRDFAAERNWDQFHTPKNLAMALSVEVAEIVEYFQWITPDDNSSVAPEDLETLREEIGDVLIYLLRLADKLGIDPLEAAAEKIAKNEIKYPVEKVKGKSLKYTKYKKQRT